MKNAVNGLDVGDRCGSGGCAIGQRVGLGRLPVLAGCLSTLRKTARLYDDSPMQVLTINSLYIILFHAIIILLRPQWEGV